MFWFDELGKFTKPLADGYTRQAFALTALFTAAMVGQNSTLVKEFFLTEIRLRRTLADLKNRAYPDTDTLDRLVSLCDDVDFGRVDFLRAIAEIQPEEIEPDKGPHGSNGKGARFIYLANQFINLYDRLSPSVKMIVYPIIPDQDEITDSISEGSLKARRLQQNQDPDTSRPSDFS